MSEITELSYMTLEMSHNMIRLKEKELAFDLRLIEIELTLTAIQTRLANLEMEKG